MSPKLKLTAIVSPSASRRRSWELWLRMVSGLEIAGAWETIEAAKAANPRLEVIVLDARQSVLSSHARGARAAAPLLSVREQQVLLLLAEGCRDKCLPERLGVSATTARTYLQRAQAKLGAGSRTEAVARWLSLGLGPRVVSNEDKPALAPRTVPAHLHAPQTRAH